MATFLIFGITGNLARHKTLPALFKLYTRKEVDHNSFICIGIGRKKLLKEEFQDLIRDAISEVSVNDFKDRIDISEIDIEKARHNFLLSIFYTEGNLDDISLYKKIKKDLDINLLSKKDVSIFCKLSLPPSMHEGIVDKLIESKIIGLSNFHLMIEKPFGQDAKTASALYKKITKNLDPKRLILIDHYLGKETIIDLMKTRVSGYMEHVIDEKNIRQIEVRLLENKSIAGRGVFYDEVGAIKDTGQNHLLQILAIAAAPFKDEKSLNSCKSAFISSLFFDKKQKNVFGQYVGYHNEDGVKKDSKTETFFSVFLRSKMKRWKSTRFCMTSGKAMRSYVAEVLYTFKDKSIFSLPISEKNRSAYEYVLLGTINGNLMLRADIKQIISAWNIVTDIKKYQTAHTDRIVRYKKGSNFLIN